LPYLKIFNFEQIVNERTALTEGKEDNEEVKTFEIKKFHNNPIKLIVVKLNYD